MTTPRLSPDEAAIPAPRTAIAITVGMIACYAGAALDSMWDSGLPHLWWYAAPLAALAALQIRHLFGSLGGHRPRYWVATTSLQVLLTYLPFLFVGEAWIVMPAFLGATLLLFIRSRLRWAAWTVVVGIGAVIMRGLGNDLPSCAYYVVGVTFASLSLYGLTRLADLVVQLRGARAELARLAVAGERERVGRDLHDLLGYRLTTITLKGELAYRLTGVDLPRARTEIAALVDISQQALSDLRTIATRYRGLSLNAEISAAQVILASVAIATETSPLARTVADDMDTTLATVLREAVANLLRHSKATRCTIRATTEDDVLTLTIRNDGVTEPYPPADRAGTGLDNLAERLRAFGGHLDAGISPPGWFELTARMPLSQPA